MYILKYEGFGINAPQIVKLNQTQTIYRENHWGKISRAFPKKKLNLFVQAGFFDTREAAKRKNPPEKDNIDSGISLPAPASPTNSHRSSLGTINALLRAAANPSG